MCLQSVDLVTNTRHKYGYKVLTRSSNKTYCSNVFNSGMQYKMNKWNIDTKLLKIKATDGEIYPCGFHYYREKPKAKYNDWQYSILVKIKVDHIVATGTEKYNGSTIKSGVCRKFRIIKIVEGKIRRPKVIGPRLKFKEPPTFKEFIRLFIENKKDELFTYILNDLNVFLDYVVFLDMFQRTSAIFKWGSTIHMQKLKTDEKYQKLVKSIMPNGKNEQKIKNHPLCRLVVNYSNHYFKKFITKIISSNAGKHISKMQISF